MGNLTGLKPGEETSPLGVPSVKASDIKIKAYISLFYLAGFLFICLFQKLPDLEAVCCIN